MSRRRRPPELGMYREGCAVVGRLTAVLTAHTLRGYVRSGAELAEDGDGCTPCVADCTCGALVVRVDVSGDGRGPWAWVHERDAGRVFKVRPRVLG